MREKLGKLVNAEGRDIALTRNATLGMNFVAQGIDLKAGDEVILTDREHQGGICGWQERAKRDSIVVKQVPITSVPRTIADVARAGLAEEHVRQAIREALHRGLTDTKSLLAEARRRGRAAGIIRDELVQSRDAA